MWCRVMSCIYADVEGEIGEEIVYAWYAVVWIGRKGGIEEWERMERVRRNRRGQERGNKKGRE